VKSKCYNKKFITFRKKRFLNVPNGKLKGNDSTLRKKILHMMNKKKCLSFDSENDEK